MGAEIDNNEENMTMEEYGHRLRQMDDSAERAAALDYWLKWHKTCHMLEYFLSL